MYRVETDPDVHQQIDSLPTHALSDYAELRVVLEVSPWSGESLNNANPDAPVRTMPFGRHQEGLATSLVLERQREVHVLMVIWVGVD